MLPIAARKTSNRASSDQSKVNSRQKTERIQLELCKHI